MLNRREFLGIAAAAGSAMALTPELLRALQQSQGRLMQRAIPSTGEMLPVVSFDPQQESDVAGMREILRAMLDNGGKVIGFPHGNGEEAARAAAAELGVVDTLFWTTSLSVAPPDVGPVLPGITRKADPAAVRAAMEDTLAKFGVPRIDLVMVSTLRDIPTHLEVLREMKREGRVRYIGVHHLAFPPNATMPPFGELESIMRNEQIDFVGTDYSVGDRRAEETILALARERKIGFMAHFTFDRGRLFQRASGTPLPAWAAEFDAKTWAQFFIKYVLAHPAVTVVRTGTTKAAHMLDNLGGGMGRLPNEAMRKRMAELVDSLPQPPKPPAPPSTPGRTITTSGQAQQIAAEQAASAIALPAAILDRYVGRYQHVAVGTIVTVRRDGQQLLLTIQDSTYPEQHLHAQSETRFVFWPYAIEFQVDGQGRVTGATWEAFQQRIPLERR